MKAPQIQDSGAVTLILLCAGCRHSTTRRSYSNLPATLDGGHTVILLSDFLSLRGRFIIMNKNGLRKNDSEPLV